MGKDPVMMRKPAMHRLCTDADETRPGTAHVVEAPDMGGSYATAAVVKPDHASRAVLAVALAFLAYNMAIGMSFGACGTLVETIQAKYMTSRALAASGISVMALVLGLFAPVVEAIARRIGLRTTMMTGALLS